MLNKIKHFYFNKYIVSPFSTNKYYLSYCLEYKALWFRVPKVATRTIHKHFLEHSTKHGYNYSSRVGYLPSHYKDYLKFAFVRDPLERLLSAWKNKVLEANYFKFDEGNYAKMKNFDEFVIWLEKQDIENADEHLLPQNKLVDIDNLDFLGRFESFTHDFNKLANKIGLPIDSIHHHNPSNKSKMDVSTSAKAIVEKIYNKDYEVFNY